MNPVTAFCWKAGSQRRPHRIDFQKIVRSLRLFRAEYIAPWISVSYGHMVSSSLNMPRGLAPSPPTRVSTDDLPSLVSWINKVRAIEVSEASILGRALERFDRTYTDSVHSRITDATIALETITAPLQAPEIGYRVRQRASFLASDDLNNRTRDAEAVKDAYAVRSGLVHTNTKKALANETLAREIQDVLRRCIARILSSPLPLLQAYTQEGKSKTTSEVIDPFLEGLVLRNNLAATFKALYPTEQPTCLNCDRPARTRGLCARHYSQYNVKELRARESHHA